MYIGNCQSANVFVKTVKIRSPNAKFRPAATARQRGEKKSEARNPNNRRT